MIKRHTSTDKQFYFTLCGKNGKVIMHSENYKTKSNMERGINASMWAFWAAFGSTSAPENVDKGNKNTLRDMVLFGVD